MNGVFTFSFSTSFYCASQGHPKSELLVEPEFMGVHGLWRLLDSFGQMTQPEQWRGKRVAVDASIWMAQFRAQADDETKEEQKILEGFFVRILKLLFYGIEAVFVFDGAASATKAAEKKKRQQHREVLAQVLLRKRARQIMLAQVASGQLKVSQLGHTEAPSHTAPQPRRAGNPKEGDVVGKKEDACDDDDCEEESAPKKVLVARPPPAKRRRRLAPESVSASVTTSFLSDVGQLIEERRHSSAVAFHNQLRTTTNSLFMGSRDAVDAAHQRGDTSPTTEPRRDWEEVADDSGSSVVSVVTVSDAVASDSSVVEVSDYSQEGEENEEEEEVDANGRQTAYFTFEALSQGVPLSVSCAGHSCTDEKEEGATDDDGEGDDEVMRDRLWNPSTQLQGGGTASLPRSQSTEWEDVTPVKRRADDTLKDSSKIAIAEQTSCERRAPTDESSVPFDLLPIIELLDHCGIPFVISPSEADAQCAFLCCAGLVDAVFSEDSDVVVHGAPTVLRGFFSRNKYVTAYRQSDLRACGITKEVLVALALLLGCDYTPGVSGIGLAGALAAVAVAWNLRSDGDGGPSAVRSLLEHFEEVLRSGKTNSLFLSQAFVLSTQHRAWSSLVFPKDYPDEQAITEFFAPDVNTDTTPFAACSPNWQSIRVFAGMRGLLTAPWVVQLLDLAQKTCTERLTQEGSHRNQRRLDEFASHQSKTEPIPLKKLPTKFAKTIQWLHRIQQGDRAPK